MSGRRMRGTVEWRSGSAWLRIKDQAGKAVRIHLGTESALRSDVAARREADQWIARNRPELLSTGSQLLAPVYFEAFITRKVMNFRGTSRRRYQSVIRTHLAPAFASTPLHRIDAMAFEDLLATLRDRGLARSTIAGVRAVLLQILRQARADGFDTCVIDPHLVRLPAIDKAEHEQRHIGAAELERILAAAAEPWRSLYAIMGMMGLRISEALGLTWAHLDLQASPLLRVRQSAQGGQLMPLKTKTSRADLPVPDELAPILRAYRSAWLPNDEGLLFANKAGSPMRADDIRRRLWNPLLARLALPPAGFHALRHGLAPRLFAQGCSAEVVRRLLRHGSLQMTQRYSHASAEDLRAAVQRSKVAQSLPETAQPSRAAQGITP